MYGSRALQLAPEKSDLERPSVRPAMCERSPLGGDLKTRPKFVGSDSWGQFFCQLSEHLSTNVSIYMFLVLAVPEVPVLESAMCVCVCVYYCSTYEKAVRVGGLV
jgi:hypothetical protein